MSEADTGQPGNSARRLVVCCDGTWNSADRGGAATNVVRMARTIKSVADDGTTQIVYYHPGVGTGNGLDRLIGGGTGVGLSRNVRDAYTFIVNNHRPTDEIFLFGFSRGAYTARSVAGLIGVIGLLPPRQMGELPRCLGLLQVAARRADATRGRVQPALPWSAGGRAREVRRRMGHGRITRHPDGWAAWNGASLPQCLPVLQRRTRCTRRARLPGVGGRREARRVRRGGLASQEALR